jgi:hypothetical protein
VQELIDLMARDIGQDATIGSTLEEPTRPGRAVQPMRAQTHRLNHAAYGTATHQLVRHGDGGNFEPLGKIDGPDATGFLLYRTDLRQLLGRGATGFVDHHILSRTHCRDGQSGPIPWDGRDHHKCDIGAVEQVPVIGHPGNIREPFHEPSLGFR